MSDFMYINKHNKNNSWVVIVTVGGKQKYLGSFKTIDEAKGKLIEYSIPILPKGTNKHGINRDYFKSVDTPEKAFWLGFICADGGITSNRGHPNLKITQKDGTLLKIFKEDIEFTGEVSLITREQKGRYSSKPFYEMILYDTEFANSVMTAGKTRYKKDLRSIPSSIPDIYIMDFIRGYFEGDGSLYFANVSNSWRFSIRVGNGHC